MEGSHYCILAECYSRRFSLPETFREGDSDSRECSKPWNERPKNVAQIANLDYQEEDIGRKCQQNGNGDVIQGVRCCNYTRAKKWHASHPNRVPSAKKKKLFMMVIKEFSNAMASINMPFHIMGGTLLGWERECGIIAHTGDIDFGIMEEDWNTTKIHNALYEHGFKYKVPFLSPSPVSSIHGMKMRTITFSKFKVLT